VILLPQLKCWDCSMHHQAWHPKFFKKHILLHYFFSLHHEKHCEDVGHELDLKEELCLLKYWFLKLCSLSNLPRHLNFHLFICKMEMVSDLPTFHTP
jgi:hypothetical protein